MMCCHNSQRNLAVLVTGWLLLVSANALAADTSVDWKTECVGRYQMSLPGEVEIILPAPRALNSDSDELIARYLSASKTFGNQGKEYRNLNFHTNSKFLYLGDIGITVEVPEIDFDNLRKMYKGRKQYYLKNAPLLEKEGYAAAADDYKEKAAEERPLDYDQKNMFGWDVKGGALIYLYRDSRIFVLDLNLMMAGETAKNMKNDVNSFLQVFRNRPLHDIPLQNGVCIPYGFIADDGKQGRHVAVTMRLIAHPDVEIFFEDKTAHDHGIKQTTQTQERTEMSMLWNQHAQSSKEIKLAFPGYRSVTLDGREGTASFVEIKRKDGSPDYGYAAVVNGDHTAKTDAPKLMLYVIRTASRGKGKPVSKNELKDIAHKIAASVKRREVK